MPRDHADDNVIDNRIQTVNEMTQKSSKRITNKTHETTGT